MSSNPGQSSRKFPDEVIVALHEAGITATCMPVQLDNGDWQAAIFYVLDPDAACLTNGKLLGGPFSVAMDADLHEHEKGTMIEIGIEIITPIEPVRGVMLFLTGHTSTHFDALRMLSQQQQIPLFIGDQYCNTLWQQRVPVNDAYRKGVSGLIDEAVARDAVIRMTGQYDSDAVFADTLKKQGIV